MPTPDSYGFLARQPGAVDHAFAVLEAVADLGPGVTSRQLTEALPMSRASVYRILKHLVAHEYLVRTPDLRGFVIGERVLALGRPGVDSSRRESHDVSARDSRDESVEAPGVP